MRVALDTNVLAYAEGVNGAAMRETALALLEDLPPSAVILPVQTLGELFRLLVQKAGRTPAQARLAIMSWRDAFPVAETTEPVMVSALDLATDHQIGIWDAVVLAAAAEADCRLVLSEDLKDGFIWRGVTVTNPFAASRHPLLTSLLKTR